MLHVAGEDAAVSGDYAIRNASRIIFQQEQSTKGNAVSGTVNGAMIGLGFGAEFLPIYAAHPNANITAICRRNEAELNKSGDQFGIEKRYSNDDDVLADPDLDFVHINSPISDHACCR